MGNLRPYRFISKAKSVITEEEDTDPQKKASSLLYLHVGPSGDCWTGPSIFAAKHLQPDYVKSIALPTEFGQENEERVEALLEAIENDEDAQRKLYDEEKIPQSILDQMQQLPQDDRR